MLLLKTKKKRKANWTMICGSNAAQRIKSEGRRRTTFSNGLRRMSDRLYRVDNVFMCKYVVTLNTKRAKSPDLSNPRPVLLIAAACVHRRSTKYQTKYLMARVPVRCLQILATRLVCIHEAQLEWNLRSWHAEHAQYRDNYLLLLPSELVSEVCKLGHDLSKPFI